MFTNTPKGTIRVLWRQVHKDDENSEVTSGTEVRGQGSGNVDVEDRFTRRGSVGTLSKNWTKY